MFCMEINTELNNEIILKSVRSRFGKIMRKVNEVFWAHIVYVYLELENFNSAVK